VKSRGVLALKLLALAAALDVAIRAALALVPYGYEAAAREARRADLRFVFVGSSRTAAAIDPVAFVREPALRLPPTATATNQGRGYSTFVEDYFGLRRLADARPGGLADVVVFVEAPGGVPRLEPWSDSWVHPAYPELLSRVIVVTDLPRFWRESDTPAGTKAFVTGALLSPALLLWGKGQDVVTAVLARIVPRLLPARADLAGAGGVLVDEASLQRVRAAVVRAADEAMAAQAPITADVAERSVLHDIVRLVGEQGGRVVLYRVPVSSVLRAPSATAVGRANAETVARVVEGWSVPILAPEFPTTDDDFPDLSHLRASRAAEFSRSLARAWAGSDRSAEASAGSSRSR
jgi:hypothetical protein